MRNQPTGVYCVLSGLELGGTHVESLAQPLGSLSAARGAGERPVLQERDPSACVVHAFHFGPERLT